jgi:hypothetical protein
MANGELLTAVMAVLKEETEIPPKVSQRFVAASLVEVYKKIHIVEGYIKGVDRRLSDVEACIDSDSDSRENKIKDFKWALEKVALPVVMLILGIIVAHIFGGQ